MVYLDHNATSPLRPEVHELLQRCQIEVTGNPSSLHGSGRRARHWLDEARERTAAALAVHEDDIVFTSGGTEANNLAILGCLRKTQGNQKGDGKPSGCVTTAIEHSSVLEPVKAWGRWGGPIEWLEVDRQGQVQLDTLPAALQRTDARLLSVSLANGEVGSVQSLQDIRACLDSLPLLEGERIFLHSDLVQALGRLPLDIRGWQLDLATLAAHKVGGPHGVGVLVRRGVALEPLMYGGGQEHGLRPGTENVAAIAATALAIELAQQEWAAHAAQLHERCLQLWQALLQAQLGLQLVGPELTATPSATCPRLAGTINVLLPQLDGKVLVTRLDLSGLEVSAGSACASGSLEPSHVLTAMGYAEDQARAGLRLSVGRDTTREDIQRAVETLRITLAKKNTT